MQAACSLEAEQRAARQIGRAQKRKIGHIEAPDLQVFCLAPLAVNRGNAPAAKLDDP